MGPHHPRLQTTGILNPLKKSQKLLFEVFPGKVWNVSRDKYMALYLLSNGTFRAETRIRA